uniref:diguanylate cyclase n=1 Tax=uncultured Thiotrichaceae bacterium TaxID=298394 RepID=A0A6S6UC59_9GAMM|nr:MAG: diguanylate cyclase/phosphodiesterase (GGDEF & EAL domains) with PAS/PAC sensor(s) [uncultured Thiotrichaceae bacterium]
MDTSKIKILSNNKDFTDLEQRAHLDLTARAYGGIVLYLAIWLTSAIWVGIFQTAPIFFVVNTALFLMGALMRLMHGRLLSSGSDFNTRAMYNWLVAILLFSGFHWGILSAWVIFSGDYPMLYYPYMVILAAFGIGGSSALSISSVVSVLYPLLVFVPSSLCLLVIGGEENIMMFVFTVFAVCYVLVSSRLSQNDYWSAISSQKVAEDQAKVMEKLSVTDQLTRLHNRMYFENRFSDEWGRCGRLDVPLAIFMIDLDHFKLINDTYGHVAGDECLFKVASVLQHEMKRATDTVARFGGEEFVIMTTLTDIVELPAMAERLVRAVDAIDMRRNGEKLSISCSIGLATMIPSRGMDKEKLLKAADKALYLAKEKGRNRYCIHGASSDMAGEAMLRRRKSEIIESETGLTFA